MCLQFGARRDECFEGALQHSQYNHGGRPRRAVLRVLQREGRSVSSMRTARTRPTKAHDASARGSGSSDQGSRCIRPRLGLVRPRLTVHPPAARTRPTTAHGASARGSGSSDQGSRCIRPRLGLVRPRLTVHPPAARARRTKAHDASARGSGSSDHGSRCIRPRLGLVRPRLTMHPPTALARPTTAPDASARGSRRFGSGSRAFAHEGSESRSPLTPSDPWRRPCGRLLVGRR